MSLLAAAVATMSRSYLFGNPIIKTKWEKPQTPEQKQAALDKAEAKRLRKAAKRMPK